MSGKGETAAIASSPMTVFVDKLTSCCLPPLLFIFPQKKPISPPLRLDRSDCICLKMDLLCWDLRRVSDPAARQD